MLSKREASLGRAAGVEGRRVRETERTTLSRGSHSQVLWSSGSFLVCLLPELGSFLGAHASLSRDGFQRSASWEVGRTSELEPPIS